MPHFAAFFAVLALAPELPAGNVLRVGPSQAYATIDAALAAAVDGDVILVDPGTYPPFTVDDLSVTIMSSGGQGSPFAVQQTPARPAIEIRNLAAARIATILHVAAPFTDGGNPAIVVDQCAGAVRLHDVRVDLPNDLPDAVARAAVEITACDRVWCEDVVVRGVMPRTGNSTTLFGAPIADNGGLCAVLLEDSVATFDLLVAEAFDNSTAVNGEAWGGDALRLVGGSYAWLVRELGLTGNSLIAGDGATFGGSAVHQVAPVGPAGVTACGPTGLARGSGSSYQNRGGLLAVDGDRGIVQSGPFTIERTVPACIQQTYGSASLQTPSLRLGTSTLLSVWSLFPRPYFVALSDTTASLPGPSGSLQMFDLSYGTTVLLGFGVLGAGPGIHSVTVPNAQGLVGLPLTLQGVLGIPGGGLINTLSLTLPAMGVVVP